MFKEALHCMWYEHDTLTIFSSQLASRLINIILGGVTSIPQKNQLSFWILTESLFCNYEMFFPVKLHDITLIHHFST